MAEAGWTIDRLPGPPGPPELPPTPPYPSGAVPYPPGPADAVPYPPGPAGAVPYPPGPAGAVPYPPGPAGPYPGAQYGQYLGPYGQSPPGLPGQDTLVLDLGYPASMFVLGMCTPQVTINGYLVASGWGPRPIPLRPGSALLEVHVPYMGMRVGRASLVLTSEVPRYLRYRPPYVNFLPGEIGVNARSRGLGLSLGITLAVLVLAVVGVLAVAL